MGQIENMRNSITIFLLALCGATIIKALEESDGERETRLVEFSSNADVHVERRSLLAMAISAAIKLGTKILNSINVDFEENAAMACYWNEWKARDARSRIERTYKYGRFSKAKKTLIFNNGRWYCCYKQAAAQQKKMKLDPPIVGYCKSKREDHNEERSLALSGVGQEVNMESRQLMDGIKAAVNIGMGLLNSIKKKYFENEGIICWWNDWKKRDDRSRKEKTYRFGRMSMYKKTYGIKNGRWYCCYTKLGLESLGQALDGEKCVPRGRATELNKGQ